MDTRFTFEELQEKNISSTMLLSWSASINLAEHYEMYLHKVSNTRELLSEKETVFYNCTAPWFGPFCHFAFDFPIQQSLDIMVQYTFKNKAQSKDSHYKTCYTHLNCSTLLLCLDWREICNEKIDCLDGSDETNCWQLEINECGKNEYRCYNGQCIPSEFLRDEPLNPDCLDRTDERVQKIEPSPCFEDPAFRCEEHTCRPGLEDFPCGDGQCTDGITICRNGRNWAFYDNLCSLSVTCLILSSNNPLIRWCNEFCKYDNCISDNCPAVFQYLPGFSLHDHVLLIFRNETTENETSTILEKYVCYNEKLCKDFLPPTMYINKLTCRRVHEVAVASPNLFAGFRQQIQELKTVFRGCLARSSELISCNRSIMYQCYNSTKCILKYRLLDGIRDCPFDDDETFNQSCLLDDVHHRFECEMNNDDRCFASLVVQDGKPDCRYRKDEREKNDKINDNHIYFRMICDGKADLLPVLIDERNVTDETDCEYWPCNNTYTRCDDFWLCKNGADEINCPPSVCPQFEHSCIFPNDTSKLSCLPISRAGDDIVDCLGASDERAQYNSYTASSHRYQYRCWNDTKYLSESKMCDANENCPLNDNERFCFGYMGQYIYLCNNLYHFHNTAIRIFLCHFFQSMDRSRKTFFELGNTPTYFTELISSVPSVIPIRRADYQPLQYNLILDVKNNDRYRCRRGLPILSRTDSISSKPDCLCPPSYYGNECQYQNQRVSLTVQIRATSNWRTLFGFVVMLIDNTGNIESYDQIEYLPIRDCNTKFNIYLLYSTRPKNKSKNYFVRIEAFNKLTFVYRGGWIFPLQFSFLPVHRLSILLTVPFLDTTSLPECTLPCIHGRCFNYVNNQSSTYCRCNPGWTGPLCNKKYLCPCAHNALCAEKSICLCPVGRFGPRCYLWQSRCTSTSCENNGQCVARDERYASHNFEVITCICPETHWGDRCEYHQTRIVLSFHHTLDIPISLLIHFITVGNKSEHIRTTTMKKIGLDQNSLTLYTSTVFNIAFVEMLNSYYLIILREKLIVSADISTQITSTSRCASIHELFNSTFANKHLLNRIKYYHIPCTKRHDLLCFYDDVHFCLCDLDHNANCFEFEHNMTYNCRGYNPCENGCYCLQDDQKCPTSSICVCNQCYYGSKCQISTKGSTLSLDIILGYRIRPNLRISEQSSIVKSVITLTVIMFCVSLINNCFLWLTFRKEETCQVGCGIYLFFSSIVSTIIICVFTIKFWILLAAQMKSFNNRSFLSFQCVTFDFCLRFLLSTGDWINACIAIERTVTAVQGINFSKSKSKRMAKWAICLVLFFTIITHIHDPIHRQLIDDVEEQRTWCMTKYSTTLQIFDWIMNIIHFSIPFLINCISALIIIFTVTRIRSDARGRESYKKLLREQFRQHRYLLISPAVLVILSFPRFYISFLSGCMKSTRNFWIFLLGYFISFIPSMLNFVIFVIPSEMYTREFYDSIRRFWH